MKEAGIPARVDIVVHGRFHAFDLARELHSAGCPTHVLTNYPKRTCARFGVPEDSVSNCISHGLAARFMGRFGGDWGRSQAEGALHRWFSSWAAAILRRRDPGIIHAFSGVAEEVFRDLGAPWVKTLMRGSAHIEVQRRLLDEERERAQVSIESPSDWMVGRERREYELSDTIFVLSTFALESFLSMGVSKERLRLLPMGSQLSAFRADASCLEARVQRVLSGGKLRILTVGTFSYRKGILDLVDVARSTRDRFEFTFVGAVPPEGQALAAKSAEFIRFVPKVPQQQLPLHYRSADIFLFPTIEDGYAVVLAQAAAAGLPIIATTNCGARDLIGDGRAGYIVPIRAPDAIRERLVLLDKSRELVVEMCRALSQGFAARDWSQVASDLLAAVHATPPQARDTRR